MYLECFNPLFGGLMFAVDFVGLTTNAEDLQTLINAAKEIEI